MEASQARSVVPHPCDIFKRKHNEMLRRVSQELPSYNVAVASYFGDLAKGRAKTRGQPVARENDRLRDD